MMSFQCKLNLPQTVKGHLCSCYTKLTYRECYVGFVSA